MKPSLLNVNYLSKAIIKVLIREGADLYEKDNFGRNALHHFIINKHDDYKSIVKFLIDLGLDVNSKDNDGCTPISYAVMYRKIKFIKTLIKNGADVNIPDNSGNLPLYYAIEEEDIPTVRALLPYSNTVAQYGNTQVNLSGFANNLKIRKLLTNK